jgi:hypothetical protein
VEPGYDTMRHKIAEFSEDVQRRIARQLEIQDRFFRRPAHHAADVEPSVVHAPSSQDAAQAPDARDLRTDFPCRGRVVIRIHCVRNRLADPDGMCVKWIIDSMVAAGVLRDDSCQFIASSPIVTQERGDEETTVVSVEEAETGDNT